MNVRSCVLNGDVNSMRFIVLAVVDLEQMNLLLLSRPVEHGSSKPVGALPLSWLQNGQLSPYSVALLAALSLNHSYFCGRAATFTFFVSHVFLVYKHLQKPSPGWRVWKDAAVKMGHNLYTMGHICTQFDLLTWSVRFLGWSLCFCIRHLGWCSASLTALNITTVLG